MHRDFAIVRGVYLLQLPHELDLHNNFDFLGVDYSVESRTATLRWRRSIGEWVPAGTPSSVTVLFRDVSEFRVNPRDADTPFSEDDCLNAFGYWTDEEWCTGTIVLDNGKCPESHWLTAVEFMSGAVILVQASEAVAAVAA